MAKKVEFDYSSFDPFMGKDVVVGLNSGVNMSGEARYSDETYLVIVAEPKSSLEIETQVVHTIIKLDSIDFIQFKTKRE